MKKIILFGLCLFFFAQAFSQDSPQEKKHLIGITIAPQNHAFGNYRQLRTIYTVTMFGLEYNYKFNKRHSIAIGGQFARRTDEYSGTYIDTTINQVLPAEFKNVSYDFNIPLHYMYHYKGWFARTGINYQAFSGILKFYRDDVLTSEYNYIGDPNNSAFEYHLAIGKDFTIGNFVGRISAFAEGPITAGSYLQYGLNAGVFYQF